VPLPVLGDAAGLLDWTREWQHGRDPERLRRLHEASARIREDKIPAYTVDADEGDSDVLRDIFLRVNKGGRPLAWDEVHHALCDGRDAGDPSTLAELAAALSELGFGTPDQTDLLRCLVAWQGLDVTRAMTEHEGTAPGFLARATVEALPTLRRVFDFLRRHAENPHLRLLPRAAPLTVLTRFFRLHPGPAARNLRLLRRVIWRSLLGPEDDPTFERRGVSAIGGDEHASVQALLKLVPKQPPASLALPESFDARAADSRLALLALHALGPRSLATGLPVDVPRCLDDPAEHDAFRRVVSG